MNIQHRTSGALAPRTNGLAENLVKKVSDLTKMFVSDDTEVEKALPLIEMSLRATAHTRLRLSPFQILFGRQMYLGHPAEIAQVPSFTGDQQEYYNWLTHRLKDIHQGIMDNRVETREQDKADYDERNRAVPPKWSVGDMVLLQDKRIKPHSNQVLCHRPYQGPFYITEIVSGDATIGPAYRLINADTGRTYKRLISSDRLKRYNANRVDLTARLPPLAVDDTTTQLSDTRVEPINHSDTTPPGAEADDDETGCEPAIRILRERTRGGIKDYYVLFQDRSKAWCTYVTPALLQYYRLQQEQKRKRRRKRKA